MQDLPPKMKFQKLSKECNTMDLQLTKKKLSGKVQVPSSKSFAHRQIICAALAKGESVIENVSMSQDIEATINAMNTLGADIKVSGTTVTVKGIENVPKEPVTIDCCESGSTLRFIIPVVAALGVTATFVGKGKLPQRPITPYVTELSKNGITFDYNGTMPFTISGKLRCGEFSIAGDISSQFVTGLILGLGIVEGNSKLILTSKLQSKPYVDITINSLELFGGRVNTTDYGYEIIGGTKLTPCKCKTECDFSQAAFFYVANALGSDVDLSCMPQNTVQGDSIVRELCKGSISEGFTLDCADIPDCVPILSVLAACQNGSTTLNNIARLRIKECDRAAVSCELINKLGGEAIEYENKIVIVGKGGLKGGRISSHNDHRIAMSAAIAATVCDEDVIIEDAGCVRKSYPCFFEDYKKLGGNVNVINME